MEGTARKSYENCARCKGKHDTKDGKKKRKKESKRKTNAEKKMKMMKSNEGSDVRGKRLQGRY